jgi:hypothetical protein
MHRPMAGGLVRDRRLLSLLSKLWRYAPPVSLTWRAIHLSGQKMGISVIATTATMAESGRPRRQ